MDNTVIKCDSTLPVVVTEYRHFFKWLNSITAFITINVVNLSFSTLWFSTRSWTFLPHFHCKNMAAWEWGFKQFKPVFLECTCVDFPLAVRHPGQAANQSAPWLTGSLFRVDFSHDRLLVMNHFSYTLLPDQDGSSSPYTEPASYSITRWTSNECLLFRNTKKKKNPHWQICVINIYAEGFEPALNIQTRERKCGK